MNRSLKPNDSSHVDSQKIFARNRVVLNIRSQGREAFDPSTRGYHAVYRDGQVNHCPGCGRTHWMIGRLLAECAFCATALPLADSHRQGQSATVVRRSWPVYPQLDAA
jgi:hypothetical protein